MNPYLFIPFLLPIGLCFLPTFKPLLKSSHLGLAYLCAWAVIILTLFVGGSIGLPLHMVAWTLVGLSGLGFICKLKPASLSQRYLFHPICIFSGIVFLVSLNDNNIGYQVLAWDAWTNWVGWSQQIVVTDSIFHPEMWISTRGDTPGWPLAMALTGLLSSKFNVVEAWYVAIAIHIGLVGFFFDLARNIIGRYTSCHSRVVEIFAWLFVLIILTMEISWSLVPTLLLIEEPQYYFLVAGFLAVGGGILAEDKNITLLFAPVLLMLTAYSIKLSFIVYAPSFFIALGWLVFFHRGRWEFNISKIVNFGMVFVVFSLLVLLWKTSSPPGRCQADIGRMMYTAVSGSPVHGIEFKAFVFKLTGQVWDFIVNWKFPITLLAVLGILFSIRRREFVIAGLVLLLMWALFLIGMIAGMASCFSAEEIEKLASAERYTRVPLRITQTIGIFLLLGAISILMSKSSVFFNRKISVPIISLGAIAILLAWQVVQVNEAFSEVKVRQSYTKDFRDEVAKVKSDTEIVSGFFQGNSAPKILYLGSRGFFESTVANFNGLGTERGKPIRALRAYHRDISFSLAQSSVLKSYFKNFQAVVITSNAAVVINKIATEIGDSNNCPNQHTGGIVLVRNKDGGTFHCFSRNVQ